MDTFGNAMLGLPFLIHGQTLILRMVDNGLEATGKELEMVAFHLNETYLQ